MHIDWALTAVTTQAVVKMAIMALAGIVCYKLKWIDDNGIGVLSKVMLNVTVPTMLLASYFTEYDPAKLTNMLWDFLASTLCHLVAIFVIMIFIHRKNNPDYEVEHSMALLSNCGSIGIPLVTMILGADKAFYVAAFMSINSLFLWIYIVLLLSGEVTKKSIKKAFLSPCLIAIYVGLIIFFARIPVPDVIKSPVQTLGNCTAPIAMLIAGASIAKIDLKKFLTNPRAYLVMALRLFITPLCCIPVFLLLRMNGDLPLAIFIAFAAASGTAMISLSAEYNKNVPYTAGLMAMNTVLSVISIPIVVAIYSMFIS